MQTRTVGSILLGATLIVGLAGCRNLPRGGLGRGPDVRTIAGVGLGPERMAAREAAPSTISSRVDPPAAEGRSDAVVGRVVDDRGVPVANARVRLAVDGAPGGREVVGTTNRSGEFLLKGLRPGDAYTLIAEWDDGREFLIGRSSVSAPAEEVRIRVASVGAATASVDRLDSSRTASFSRQERATEPETTRDDPPGPIRLEAGREARPAERPRAGWIPADSVRRASLGPSDLDEWPLDDGAIEPERPRTPMFVDRLRSGDADRAVRIEESPDLDPEDFPAPMATIDPGSWDEPPRSTARGASPRRSGPADEVAPPRTTADSVPLVRRFEPESARARDVPDPPLLMTDAPPEDDATDDEDRDRTSLRPGSMLLPSAPARPSSSAGVAASAPGDPLGGDGRARARDDRADRDEQGTGSAPEDDAGFEVPEPAESEAPTFEDRPAPGRVSSPSDPSPSGPDAGPIADDDRGGRSVSTGPGLSVDEAGPGPEEEDGPRFVRWADLPPPAPLGRAPDAEGDPAAVGPGGRWARGLLKWASRDDPDQGRSPRVEPAVRYDAERDRLDDFTLPDLNGHAFRLQEASSDYVLLCFWGTWCDPCLAAMPHLADLQRQFGPSRLRVVSIAYQRNGEGGPRSLRRVARRLGLNYPILLAPADGPCPVAEAMQVQYYPTLILLDRDGRVVHRETGATGEKLMRLDRAIAAAMDQSVMTVTRR